MSGTGRRRKPPTGDEGDEQYAPPAYEQQPYEQQPYQTYAPTPEPQYDYDWRQSAAAAPTAPPPSQPTAPPAQPVVPRQPIVPQQPQYDQYDQFHQSGQYVQQPPAPPTAAPTSPPPAPTPPVSPAPTQAQPQPQYDNFTPRPSYGAYQPPPAPPQAAATPPPPAPAPEAPGRPRPRPEPREEFEFDFDLDFDEPNNTAAGLSASSTGISAAPPEVAPATATDSASASASVSSGTGSSGRVADKDGYRVDDFDFVDKSDEPDVGSWLTFTESRADSRAERIRRMRARLLVLGVVLVLVAAGVGIYAWLGGSVPGISGTQATKSLILFRLDGTSGDAVGDALLVTERDGSTDGTAPGNGAIVVIPSQMQIDDQGFGSQPFGGNMPDQPPADAEEVSSTLGVDPDGTWTMNETTFSLFVDDLEGISVTTNTAIAPTTADPKGVPAGATTLSGPQAIAYATYQATGESPSVQAARFGQVLEAFMAKMPTHSNAVGAYLNNLAIIPDPQMPLDKLGPILAALAAQEAGGRVTIATLPLAADGSNTLNATGASQIVTKLLGGTVKTGATAGQSARVLVQNGTGTSGDAGNKLVASAQAKLVDSGYTFNAGSTVGSQAHTVVEVAASSGKNLAQQVAASLGLSGSAVQVVTGLSSVDDVTVVLGQDWTSLSTQ